MKNWILHLSLLFCLFITQFSYAQIDPSIEWKTLRSEHFDLAYNAKQQELAEIYITALENNHQLLKKTFVETPSRTFVVLLDNTDLPNGYATPIPYPSIVLFPVLPSSMMSIGEYGNWAHELTVHEYAHVLSFEPAHGFMKYLRMGLGSIIAPNILLPRWWLEGIAVHIETAYSSHGRIRSTYQDAILRAMTQEKTLLKFKIDEINESSIPTWPYGSRPYLFGSLMWSEMIHAKGDSIIEQLHKTYGGRVPYLLEGPAIDILGAEYIFYFEQSLMQAEARSLQQIKTIQTAPLSELKKLDFNQRNYELPQVSPDGKSLVVIATSETGSRSLQIFQRPQNDIPFQQSHLWKTTESTDSDIGEIKTKDNPPQGSIAKVSWFPNSQKIVFDKVDHTTPYTTFSDLHTYDLVSKKSKQITNGLRAKEASVSPDGKQIVFTQVEAGKTKIALIDADGKNLKLLVSPPLQFRTSHPLFLNEHEVLFSLRSPDGKQKLQIVHIQEMSIRDALTGFQNPDLAEKTPLGILFQSTQNGVPNLYLADLEFTEIRAITNTTTAVFSGSMDPQSQDLYVTKMTETGHQVTRIPAQNWKSIPASLPVVTPLYSDRYQKDLSQTNTQASVPVAFEKEDYQASKYLAPQYWIPTVFQTDEGWQAQFQTSGNDPLNQHSYLLNAGYQFEKNDPNYLIQYNNQQTQALIQAITLKNSEYVLNTEIEIENQQHALASQWFLPYDMPHLTGGFGWLHFDRKTPSTQTTRSGPEAYLNYQNYSMSSTQVTPESGWGAQLRATFFDTSMSYIRYNQINAGGVYYFSKYLPKRHALMARGQFLHSSKDLPFLFSTSSSNTMLSAHLLTGQFLMRGYLNGQFVGDKINNLTLEYRMPFMELYRGFDTFPLYMKKTHLAFVMDAIQVDGFVYDPINETYESTELTQTYANVGAEIKMDITLGYSFPVTVFMGVYKSSEEKYSPGALTLLGIQL